MVNLLRGREANDALAVRLERALRQLGRGEEADRLASELETRFEDEVKSGSGAHLREYAIFLLQGEREAGRILELARKNWELQRETADSRLLVQAALRARDPMVLGPLKKWISENRFEDLVLEELLKRFEAEVSSR